MAYFNNYPNPFGYPGYAGSECSAYGPAFSECSDADSY